MRNNYRSGTKQMTDEQVLEKYYLHFKYRNNKSEALTSNMTKACYYEEELIKRGWTEEAITDWYNSRQIAELEEVN